MPRRKRDDPNLHERDPSPTQQDEGDILEEAGAERDEDTGDLVVTEETVRTLGAVDATSVRENRRLQRVADKKRAGKKDVPFNTRDPIVIYDTILKYWTPDTIDINVKKLIGGAQHMVTSRPLNGAGLYEVLRGIHGPNSEAEYEVKFTDAGRSEYRGTGRITMPDARPTQQQPQQGPAMQPYYPNGMPPAQQGYGPQPTPAGYGTPPGYPAAGYPSQAPQQPAPQQPQQPAPQPQVVVQPPAFDPSGMMSMMDQLFGMFRQMQSAAQPPAPQPQYVQPAPPQVPVMPPMPAPTASPAEQIAWMQEAFRLFQQMQPQQPAQAPARGGREAPPTPQVQNPMLGAMGMPPMAPPPGMIFVPGIGYVAFDALMRAMSGQAPQAPERPYRGPSAPYQRGYDPSGGPGPRYGGPSGYGEPQGGGPPSAHGGPPSYGGSHTPQYGQQPPPPPAARPQSAADQLRGALSIVREAANAVQEMDSLLPGRRGEEPVEAAPQQEDDESPIQVIEAGPAKLVIDKKSGAIRTFETMWSNAPDIMKWLGEQREAIQRNANERAQLQHQQQHPQQLPPGYVEVRPGYQPPPGYVAVPIDPRDQPQPQPQQQQWQPPQQGLPPPPAHMPPPLQQEAPPPGRRSWNMPTDQGDQ